MKCARFGSLRGSIIARFLVLAVCIAPAVWAYAQRPAAKLSEISSDPYTIPPGQHATEVEPHALAFGSTIVASFQTGRISPGGATDIGWATSTDGGSTWTHGFLPGLTTGEGTGPYSAASDPAVAYDPKHVVWMIATLPIADTQTPAVTVSRSTDGGFTWNDPVSVDPTSSSSDKNWIVCDTSSTSPFYGNCYVEWDNPYTGIIYMSTSTDGGQTWGSPVSTSKSANGLGGQPLVQSNGTVIVPYESDSGAISAFTSTTGGTSWTAPVTVSRIQSHTDAGGIRSGPLPSAAIDGAGNVWVTWEDCRFRSKCSTNDLVYSTSSNGTTWSAITRVPIDATTSTVDHFIPGIGIEPTTSGATAHVAIHYYYYSNTSCTTSTCELYVGYISSPNGGSTWNPPTKLAGPMKLAWLPNSQNGLMVGDYIATVFNSGVPHGVFAVAAAKSGSTFNEATFTAQGLKVPEEGAVLSSAGDKPLHHLSDKIEQEHPEKGFYPPSKSARRSQK
ncbi:MAG TPA: sialidase family protein [Candidatus Sulfotelmatobacter sp.]|nr:sialidase family protein [Candidatus Sulfotelmatobacter sp.]